MPAEYQRGRVWTGPKKSLFIDSILRGYPTPILYLSTRDMEAVIQVGSQLSFTVIDGQQRLTTLSEFMENKVQLTDTIGSPSLDEPEWANRSWSELNDALKLQFEEYLMTVQIVRRDSEGIDRDIFIRLQRGSPLSAQENRDALPGEFPEFVKRLVGHDHGERVQKPWKVFEEIRGKDDTLRRYCAEMYVVWDVYTRSGQFADYGHAAVTDWYHRSATAGANDTEETFKDGSREAERFEMVLEACTAILGKRKGKWPAWAALHLSLLIEELDAKCELRTEWITQGGSLSRETIRKITETMDGFATRVKKETEDRNAGKAIEKGTVGRFAQLLGTQAMDGDALEERHEILRAEVWQTVLGRPYTAEPYKSRWRQTNGDAQ